MPFEKSGRTALVLATLVSAIAFGARPSPAFAKPAHLAHESLIGSGGRAHRNGTAFFPAPRVGSFAAAPRDMSGGVCDHGDDPMIC